MNHTDTSRPLINRLQSIALGIGVLGLAALGAGFAMDQGHEHFYQSYLLGFMFWNGITVGFLGLLMLHHMVGGEWGYVNRRFFEAGAMCSILMAILVLPIIFGGMPHLYEWAVQSNVDADAVLREKAPYLNLGFFHIRVIIYFVFWIGSAFLLNKWSADCDKTGTRTFRTKARALSGPGILLYVIIYTFYIVDFMMSLEPHWYSTIFALLLMVGATLSTLSLTTNLMNRFRHTEPMSKVLTPDRFWDIGNLMLAFTMLWAYMAFSQYLISWAGNLPEDSQFYIHRLEGPWRKLALALVFLHFVIPFFLLLQRRAKKAPAALASIGLLLMLMRLVDLYWLIRPSFAGEPAANFFWTDIAAPIAIGGVWMATFCFILKGKAILPVYETHHDRLPVKSEVYTHG